MKSLFGETPEASTTPPKKAAKKAAKKTTTKYAPAEPTLHDATDYGIAAPLEPQAPKKRAAKKSVTSIDKPRSAAQLRRDGERLIAKADAAEAREILSDAKEHVKALKADEKRQTKELATTVKSLAKAEELLKRLEGPGE